MQGAEIIDRAASDAAVPERAPLVPSPLRQWRWSGPKSGVPGAIGAALEQAVTGRRLFVLLPFAMIAGLVAYAQLPAEPHPWALAGGAIMMMALLALASRSAILPVISVVAAAWLGACLLPIHGQWFGTTMLARPAYGTFEARVEEIVSATAEARRIVVSGLTPVAGDRAVDIERARLVVPPEPPLAPGDIIRASVRLAPVPGPILPGAYDGQFHSYFAGVGAYGTVTGGGFELVSHGSSLDLTRGIETTRMAIGARIDAVLDDDAAAIGRAMVMGDQSAITDETRDIMAASGLAHIYSISGLHLSIVAGGMFWLVRWALAGIPAASRWPVKKIAAVMGLLAAAGYMMLAGGVANVPALRSAIMLGLIFGAVLAGRRALTMRNVAIAALAIIVIDPASVFRASFQLSFAAVVALIGVYEMPGKVPDKNLNWASRLWGTIWATALTSFIAGGATLLFSAYHFQQTAPLGVLGNVLVLPVVSIIIMPFAVLSVLAMPFGIEAPFVAVMGWGIDRMVDGAELVAGWSAGLTGNPLLTGLALIIGLTALAWFAFFSTWWRMLGPAIAVPLLLLFGFDQRPDLLVADTTQAVVLRSAEGLGMISGRTGSFAVDAWSEHYQEVIAEAVPGLHCESLGCIARTPDFSIAVVKNAAAFAEDCGLHDLLIARIRAPATCSGGQVIDAGDLAAGGVHWLRWDAAAARFDIRIAIPSLTRPWRVVPP